MSTIHSSFRCAWSIDATLETEIVDLFLTQTNPDYISHAELQGNRADTLGRWRTDLADSLLAQVRAAHAQGAGLTATALIATAYSENTLAGVAFVSIDQAKLASRVFATLDDLIVQTHFRGAGVGQRLVDWVSTMLQQRGIQRLFLESGINNEGAHQFFANRGFVPVSVVMLKELTSNEPGTENTL
jgi:GNAT superfamily N-acetyltransferase